ncbi:MAG: hypothetical protein JO286_20475 [Solirubrobacterales bacterium]|nr:hypothetical protein [Solirubrobacterales bacterium]
MADSALALGMAEQDVIGGLRGQASDVRHDLLGQTPGYAHRLVGELGHVSPVSAQPAESCLAVGARRLVCFVCGRRSVGDLEEEVL